MIGSVTARRQQETLSMIQGAPPGSVQPAFDLRQRYVRLLQVRADGFIEFEFAIGDPELSVDLILPADAYREFCRHNDAIELPSIGDSTQPPQP